MISTIINAVDELDLFKKCIELFEKMTHKKIPCCCMFKPDPIAPPGIHFMTLVKLGGGGGGGGPSLFLAKTQPNIPQSTHNYLSTK